MVDEDGLPGDETNYYGMVAYGFDTKEEALAYISTTEHARLSPAGSGSVEFFGGGARYNCKGRSGIPLAN